MQDDDVTLAPAVDLGRVLHSDPHDFAGLYIRHRSSFTLHARRYLNDPRDCDEVVQEAFLRLFLALPELETELQALAYCRRTITNLCIDRYRAQARRPRLIDLDSVPADLLADVDEVDPVVRAEDAATVREALSLLSPLHRAALVKREIEEKPLPVIAAELDIPEESVKHVLFRARRALRRLLAGTSLAPGQDGEDAVGLGGLLAKGPAGLAALLLIFVVTLSTGPDLRSIPVAGASLPDLPSVGEVARAVGQALTGRQQPPAQTSAAGGGGQDAAGPEGTGMQQPGGLAGPVAPSPSPSAVTLSSSDTSTVGLLPTPAVSPTSIPPPSAEPTPEPTPTPSVRPSRSPVPTDPSPSASASASASVGPNPVASASSRARKPSPSPSVSPSASPSATPSQDATAYDTPGLEYQNDPVTLRPVLVPVGTYPTPGSSSY